MLCSSSITLGLCTTIGLCTQTNKHRSSCVTERIRAILLSLTSDIWTGHWVYWGICIFIFFFWVSTTQMHFQVRGCSSVRPSVCPPLDYISSYSSMTRWTRARLAQWFLQIVVAICVLLCNDQCMKVYAKSQNVFRDDCKKKENKTIGIRKNGITVL